MFDTHCHLFDPPLSDDVEGVLTRARAAGVTGICIVSTDWNSWDRIGAGRGIPERHLRHVAYGVGLHPWFVTDAPQGWADRVREMAPSFDAIGEIGLDRGSRAPDIELQKEPFFLQMELAEELGKPALLHVVRAHDLVLEYIKAHPRVRGIIHAFSGSPADARSYVDKGWFLGIGGGVTRERAHRLRRIVKGLPLEAIVLETDAPYLGTDDIPPGKSEPSLVAAVATKLAELFGRDVEEIVQVTTSNAIRALGLEDG